MPNALSTPAPPNIGDRANVGGNALSGAPGQPQPVAPQPPPAPSHQQTVAALRHFGAIKRELTTLLSNPDVGRTNLRSAIVDGSINLVENGILTPNQAVNQLGTVPDEPFQQKAWLEKQLATAIQASNAVLDHHRIAFAGMPVNDAIPDPDQHTDMISALTSNYKGAQNA